ncbi:MAG: hypothetical protein RLZZ450_4162, partial [Pseudomonadota bacterium]
MSSRGPERSLVAHDEVGRRDVLIAELRHREGRLRDLLEISKVLLRFETIDRTLPEVLALVSQNVPLRSAIFVQDKGGDHALLFRVEGGEQKQLEEAKSHVAESYGYLVPSSLKLELEYAPLLVLPIFARPPEDARRPAQPPQTEAPAPPSVQQLVLLPLVGAGGAIFGALQVAGMSPMGEPELVFFSDVVTQLATALVRDARERALTVSEAKLAGIVSMAMDAVITVDETLHISMFNAGAERIFGWATSEVLGKSIELLLPTRFHAAHALHLNTFRDAPEAARTMGGLRPAIYGRRKNGQEFYADAAISKLFVGGAWLFTVFLRDITEQKRIEHEQLFLSEVSTLLIGTLDNEQTLGDIARLAMTGIADFCVIEFVDEGGQQRRLDVLTREPEKEELAEALKAFPLDRTRPHLSAVLLDTEEAQVVSEVTPAFLRSFAQDDEHLRLYEAMGLRSLMGVPLVVAGRLLGALIVGSCQPGPGFGDADHRLLAQIGQRAALALESARLYRVAQRAVQVRDDVLGVVAHDLRNPLGSILMQAALFRRKGEQPERRSSRPGDVIERAAKRMNRLIQDLLDITSIDAGRLSIDCTAVDARQVLVDLIEAQQSLASARSLELRLDSTASDVAVWVDRERLFQVLENLVGNAAKFWPSGGTISVGARRRGDEVLFWVEDCGAGISEEDLPHLFDRFWQVKKTARRGAGLGLAIVKGLIESHGGRIWVETTV